MSKGCISTIVDNEADAPTHQRAPSFRARLDKAFLCRLHAPSNASHVLVPASIDTNAGGAQPQTCPSPSLVENGSIAEAHGWGRHGERRRPRGARDALSMWSWRISTRDDWPRVWLGTTLKGALLPRWEMHRHLFTWQTIGISGLILVLKSHLFIEAFFLLLCALPRTHTHLIMADEKFGAEQREYLSPPREKMSVSRYAATRITTLKPAMDRVGNPIALLRLLNLQQWMFFLVAFFAWTWDAFDFFTVSLTVEELAESFHKTKKGLFCQYALWAPLMHHRHHLGHHSRADAAIGRQYHLWSSS